MQFALVPVELLTKRHTYSLTEELMLWTILLVFLILAAVGSLPTWPHSRSWGYQPSGVLGVLLVAFIVMAFLGYIPLWHTSLAH